MFCPQLSHFNEQLLTFSGQLGISGQVKSWHLGQLISGHLGQVCCSHSGHLGHELLQSGHIGQCAEISFCLYINIYPNIIINKITIMTIGIIVLKFLYQGILVLDKGLTIFNSGVLIYKLSFSVIAEFI